MTQYSGEYVGGDPGEVLSGETVSQHSSSGFRCQSWSPDPAAKPIDQLRVRVLIGE